jgi:hypothetical protein
MVEGPTDPIRDSDHSAGAHHMTHRNGEFARTLAERNREA